LLLVALVAIAGVGSLALGQDANWDLQNYHYYNPWAWWHDRTFTRDVAAAQVQTFHNPLLDLPFYALVSAGVGPRVIAFVLAVPAAIAAFVLCKLSLLLFGELPRAQRTVAVACSAAVGTTSAMGIGALANTMNEWPLAALLMLALWLVARAAVRGDGGAIAARTLLLAGALAGIAAGAKLTAGIFAVGLGAAVLGRGPYAWRDAPVRVTEAGWFALGAIAGSVIALGPWAYSLWTHFGNPVFPYFNQWIQSPWWEQRAVPMPHAFGPRTLAQWAALPFTLGDPPLFYVAEVPYRDGRFPLTTALALAGSAAWFVRRSRAGAARASGAAPAADAGIRAAWRIVALFAIVSFVVWAGCFGIYRYLLILDVLTGLLVVGLLRVLAPPRIAIGAAVLATAALMATTRVADWGRVEFGERWFEIRVPQPRVDDGALVLITTGGAVSYLIPLLPPGSRYVAVLNTAVDPAHPTRLTETVDEIVRTHPGALYQLTYPLTEGAHLLPALGLARTTACAVIITNMPTSPLELCRLVRVQTLPGVRAPTRRIEGSIPVPGPGPTTSG
jgi:hypothetical protein